MNRRDVRPTIRAKEAATFYVLLLGPPFLALAFLVMALVAITRLARDSRLLGLGALSIQLVIAAGGVGYMEITLRHLAREAGHPIYGLIGHPIPNTGGDHEYTEHGKEYEWSAFELPFYVTAGAMVLASVFLTVAARGHRRVWLVVWLGAVGLALSTFIFWAAREFTAWDIFI